MFLLTAGSGGSTSRMSTSVVRVASTDSAAAWAEGIDPSADAYVASIRLCSAMAWRKYVQSSFRGTEQEVNELSIHLSNMTHLPLPTVLGWNEL